MPSMGLMNIVTAPLQIPSGAGPLVACAIKVASRLSLVDGQRVLSEPNVLSQLLLRQELSGSGR